jgi:hypothetical protein
MSDNQDINYNLMEPEIFSIPKKPIIKDFDNFRASNKSLQTQSADNQNRTIRPSINQDSNSSIFNSNTSVLGSKTTQSNKIHEELSNKNELYVIYLA